MNLVVAAAGAMVIVDNVVLVRNVLDGDATDVAIALCAFGGGSMISAILLPKFLTRKSMNCRLLWKKLALGAMTKAPA